MENYSRKHNVFVVRSIGRSFNRHSNLKFENFKLQNIVGLVSNDNMLCYCSQDDRILYQTRFSDTLTWTGEWLGFFYDDVRKQGLFATDFFGFGHIFYGIFDKNGERLLIVGDSFRGVNKVAQDILGSFGVNWDVALPHLISPQTIFEGRISYRTFSQDINILHENELLVFGSEGISIVQKPISKTLEGLSYNQLIQQGIEKAQGMVKVAVDSGRQLELSLSGGKDSRAVLGLILASGYHKNVGVFTAPSSAVADGASREILDLDFKLACQLTQYFGMKWNTNNNFKSFSVDFDDALNFWQDHRGALSFNFRPKFEHFIGRHEIHFTGGGGELLRDSITRAYKENFNSWWGSCGKDKDSIKDDLIKLYSYLCDRKYIDIELYKQSANNFSSSMAFESASNVLDCLILNDIKYDNRNHFSVAHTAYSQGILQSYLLCVPEFIFATKHLDPIDYQDGKVLFDIIECTCPDLHTLSYASPAWNKSFKTKGIKDWSLVSGDRQMQSYASLLESRRLIKDIRKTSSGYDFYKCCKNKLIFNMNYLRDFAEYHSVGFFDGVIERVARLYQLSEKHLSGLIAKTETLMDIITGVDVNCQISVIDAFSSHFTTQSDLFWRHSNTYYDIIADTTTNSFSHLCDRLDMSEFSFVATINTDEKKISIDCNNIKNGCEIACYLYENGVKIDQIWYQECTTMNFLVLNLDLKNRYRVTVFYRWKGELIAQKTESKTLN